MVVRRDERITRIALGSADPRGRLKSGDDAPQLVEAIALDRIDRDRDQPRRQFDPVQLQELADSLIANGQIQPIAVTRKGDRYMLLVGERRWRAAQQAGLATIRAIVRSAPLDAQRTLIAQIVENEQRDPLTVSELVGAVAKLAALGMKNVEIARALSRNPTRISELQALADAPPPLAAILDTIGLGLSYQLLRQWRAHPEAALDFLAQMPPEHVSRVTIATIGQEAPEGNLLPGGGPAAPAARAAVPGEPVRPPTRPGKGEGAPSAPTPSRSDLLGPGPDSQWPLSGGVEVEHPDHGRGRLVFDGAQASGHVAISFAGGAPVTVPASEVRIVRTFPSGVEAP